MTPIEEIFKALETLNQNDFIDWLLANKQNLIEDDKMHLRGRQEPSEQSSSTQMGERRGTVHCDIYFSGSPTENIGGTT